MSDFNLFIIQYSLLENKKGTEISSAFLKVPKEEHHDRSANRLWTNRQNLIIIH